MAIFLETKRLGLWNLEQGDESVLVSYRNDPECAKYQRWEDTSPEAVRQLIGQSKEDIFPSEKEEQHYAIYNKEGIVGDLSCFYTEADRCVTFGITIAPDFQRRGYAFEILQAAVKAVQKWNPRLDIVALIDKENAPSVALFEKLGFYRECYAERIQSFVYVIDGYK